jgi:hypothetical protein
VVCDWMWHMTFVKIDVTVLKFYINKLTWKTVSVIHHINSLNIKCDNIISYTD